MVSRRARLDFGTMLVASDMLEVCGPGADVSFRIKLLGDKNRNVVENILKLLPMRSFLLHVVVAGETIYMPAPSISLQSKNMVKRQKGSVYYNTTSQSICICYGAVTESTLVNEFAKVVDEDLPNLERLGRLVYQQTVSLKEPSIIETTIRLPAVNPSPPSKPVPTHLGIMFDGSWNSAKDIIEAEIANLRLPEEPDEIKTIRLGATKARAGSEASSLQTIVFLQGFLSTLGPHIFSRLLTISAYDDMSVSQMVRLTREFLTNTFNHFEFLADLGLEQLAGLGEMYSKALDSLKTLEQYQQLTDSMRTLIQLLYRWLHLIFPWFLKDQFQSRTPEEAARLPKLKTYSAPYDTFGNPRHSDVVD